ncbi:MAG: phosphate-starvation-inducible PsiE family protein [Nitrospirae bacterium]|nr:phosphate-starvation-inducible PsiE family protein [Nitrospirota bacterium]
MSEIMQRERQPEFYFWIHSLIRKYVEITLDIILIGLVFVTFVFIGKTIYNLAENIYSEKTDIAFIISEIMFVFILIEVVRLLIIYLQYHRVAIDTMVEISIVSILRELILNGVLHTRPVVVLATSVLIIVLMLLLRVGGIRYRLPDTYPEYRPFFKKSHRSLGR